MVISSYKFVFIQVALVISVTIIQCAKQPNLLFILADDYGWNDIGECFWLMFFAINKRNILS